MHCELSDEVNMEDHQLVRTRIDFPVVDVFYLHSILSIRLCVSGT